MSAPGCAGFNPVGTYDDSKYVIARKCHRAHCCPTPIEKGERYLVFKLGLRNDLKVHEKCSLKTHTRDGFYYHCKAVEDAAAVKK